MGTELHGDLESPHAMVVRVICNILAYGTMAPSRRSKGSRSNNSEEEKCLQMRGQRDERRDLKNEPSVTK